MEKKLIVEEISRIQEMMGVRNNNYKMKNQPTFIKETGSTGLTDYANRLLKLNMKSSSGQLANLSDKVKQQIYMDPVRNFTDCEDLDQLNEKELVALTDQLMSLKEVTESPDFKKVLTNEQQKIWKLFYECVYKKTEEKNKKGTQPSLTSSTGTTEFTSTTNDWTETDELTVLKYGSDPRYEIKSEPFMINNTQRYKYFYRPKISGRKD
jgi:hypothetical protein